MCVDFDAVDGHENGERSVGEDADEGVGSSRRWTSCPYPTGKEGRPSFPWQAGWVTNSLNGRMGGGSPPCC